MKKTILISILIFTFVNVKSNPKLDSIFYIHYNLGLNTIIGKGDVSLPYGVGLAENNIGPGFGMGLGLEVLLRKKWGVRISGGIGAHGTNRSKFEKSLKESFPGENFISDDNGYFSHGLSGATTIGWMASLSYDIEFEKLILRPRLNFGYVYGGAVKYSYVLRTPASNLITNHSIYGSSDGASQIGIGVEISPKNYRPVSFYVNFNGSRFVNNYKATINDVYGNNEVKNFSSNYSVSFLNLGINLGFDIFMPREPIN